jgi:[ribosomal protein S5]-alanine N-acetyltransferase
MHTTSTGKINLNEIVRGPAQSAYLGYWIGAPYAKQGYMTEALPLALSHAFQVLGLHRVEANIMPTNRPSLALVRRAGFHREGYSPMRPFVTDIRVPRSGRRRR